MNLRVAMVGHVDHGKSTLIGRLLADTGQTRDERKDRVQSFCQSTGRKFEYAFLLDALEEEQAQGITLDVTEVNWNFNGRGFVFVDTPGHREFLKKMVGGASRVDAAVLILDVNEEIQDSFRRQIQVLDLLGVKHRIVVINKMDLVNWSQEAWIQRESELRQILASSPYAARVVPAAAWHGANLLSHSDRMPWYFGPTLIEALFDVDPDRERDNPPVRFFVQDVYREGDKRIVVGRVESGEIRPGDPLLFYPTEMQTRVTTLECYAESREVARTGDSIGLTLADPFLIERGALACDPGHRPKTSRSLVGDLFWLDIQPLRVGERLKFRMGTRTGLGTVKRIHHEIHAETFVKNESALTIELFGRVQIQMDESWAFDEFEHCEPTGRFVVSRDELVVGGGRWVKAGTEAPKGRVFWLTGLSGAGKTTLAQALKVDLLSDGIPTVLLDGDVLRSGLCSDLGFSGEDREENLRRISEVAKLIVESGFTAIVAAISPLNEHRARARETIGVDRFYEIFVDCPLEVCEGRDVKGLYARARRGEIANFTGVSAPFEAPANPDLHLHTDRQSISDSLFKIKMLIQAHQNWEGDVL